MPRSRRHRLRSSRVGTTDTLKAAFVRGLAILLPLVVTLLVLSFVFGFIANSTSPLVTALIQIPGVENRTVVTLVTLIVFVVLVIGIGLGAEHGLGNGHLGPQFDALVSSLPGIGPLYHGLHEMSELLLDSDSDSFHDVKLVEYPTEGSYAVAFKTAETSSRIRSAVSTEKMMTLFVPMAPNPVMGGFVLHVQEDRVIDVDLSVEEGIRSIFTSGVAMGDEAAINEQHGAVDTRTGDTGPGIRAADVESSDTAPNFQHESGRTDETDRQDR
jgi:uncharacterized membrane protein